MAQLTEGGKRPRENRISPDGWFGLWIIGVILAIGGSCATCRYAEHTWPDRQEDRMLDLERRVEQIEDTRG